MANWGWKNLGRWCVGLGAAGCFVLCLAGCSTFRAMFSRPAEPRPNHWADHQSSKSDSPTRKSGRRKISRDPVSDMFAFEKRDRSNYMKNHDLSDRERELMQDSFQDDDLAGDYAKKVHFKYQENRLKTKEHVFGPNPFRK